MGTTYRKSEWTSQHLVAGLLVVFIGLSVFAMFNTSKVGNEMSWIGMNVARLDAETQAARGIPTSVGGVLVEGADGLAGRAGVRQGDLVVGINGNRVQDMFDFQHFTGEADVTKGAQIDVIRNGVRTPVFVFPSVATTQAAGQAVPAAGVAQNPLAINQWLGIEGDTVMAADAMELGLPVGAQGVAVDGVAIGGRAEKAGLVRRDVIVAVNGQRIGSASELWTALGNLNGADSVELGVYRSGQLATVLVPAGAGAATGTPAAVPAGGFAGRMGGMGLGPGGLLACPKCGTKVAHQRGVPCFAVACPSCGTTMTRVQ